MNTWTATPVLIVSKWERGEITAMIVYAWWIEEKKIIRWWV